MAFTTSTATDYLDMLNDWKVWMDTTVGWTINEYTQATNAQQVVETAPIQSGGTGYVVGEIITFSGGTFTTAATVTVTTVSTGVVTGVSISEEGNYTVLPSNPVSTTASASGTGATFNPTWIPRTSTLSMYGAARAKYCQCWQRLLHVERVWQQRLDCEHRVWQLTNC